MFTEQNEEPATKVNARKKKRKARTRKDETCRQCYSWEGDEMCTEVLGTVRLKESMECSRCGKKVMELFGCDECKTYTCCDCQNMMTARMLNRRLKAGRDGDKERSRSAGNRKYVYTEDEMWNDSRADGRSLGPLSRLHL